MDSRFKTIVETIGRVVLGKEDQIQLALTCLFAQGHLLIEDLPGIGKTTLAKVLARCLGLNFHRIQFTSDMLPGDILGTSVFDGKSGTFIFHPGPIFSQVLLADEINRATPKTQSALLEAMEENQVTIEGRTRRLENPFFVIATQNPLEHSGTFSLPESQLDRFLMRITVGYPDRLAERKLLAGKDTRALLESLQPCLHQDEVLDFQEQIKKVHAADAFLEYLQDLLDFTRNDAHFHMGLSPRAGLALLQASKSLAYLKGRQYAEPEDLQTILPWVAGHRLRSRETMNEFPIGQLMDMFGKVPIP